MNEELIQWLKANKIQFTVIDNEVIDIPKFGRVFVQNNDEINSIFEVDHNGDLKFNCLEKPDVLMEDNIFHVAFKFGYNWYYTDLRQEFSLNILKYIGQREECSFQEEFVNLGVHTSFELLNGSFLPKMWVKKALYLGHKAIGICDKNTMAACYSLQKECALTGIKPVFGYSLVFEHGENKVGAKVYVQTQEGLGNLLRIQKAIMVDRTDGMISFDELVQRGAGNVLVLDKYSSQWMIDYRESVYKLQDAFIDVNYQVDLSEYKAERIDIKVLESTKLYFEQIYNTDYQVFPILLSDCYYLDHSDYKNKIILNKIASGAAHEQSEDQYFKDIDEHYAIFQQLFDSEKWDVKEIFKTCCESTMLIADNAEARFDTSQNYMPKYMLTEEEKAKYGDAHTMFCQALEDGLNKLVPEHKREQYRKQMEFEKYIIESTDNVDYLLVQYDTCNWARKNGILVGCGRGSAAGSLLLYLLGITLIDPIKYGLIFERFLLPERAGLYSTDTTVIGTDIESKEYVEVTLENGKMLKIDIDAQLLIRSKDNSEPKVIYADQLKDSDEILFDNKDELFTINEI